MVSYDKSKLQTNRCAFFVASPLSVLVHLQSQNQKWEVWMRKASEDQLWPNKGTKFENIRSSVARLATNCQSKIIQSQHTYV